MFDKATIFCLVVPVTLSTLVRCVARAESRPGRVAAQYFSRMLSSRLRDLANTAVKQHSKFPGVRGRHCET